MVAHVEKEFTIVQPEKAKNKVTAGAMVGSYSHMPSCGGA